MKGQQNIFLNCELFVERQNCEKFSMLGESDFKVKELTVKGSSPRSHESGKKHFTDNQISAQATGSQSYGTILIQTLLKGTGLASKDALIVCFLLRNNASGQEICPPGHISAGF